MLIFGIFEQSIELEQALAELDVMPSLQGNILVVFMDHPPKNAPFNEHSPHPFEVGISFGTAGAVIGASSGFALTIGPILWGLIGFFFGFCLGLCTHFLYKKFKIHSRQTKKGHDVTVVIQCQGDLAPYVSDVFWKYQARSVGTTEGPG